MDTCWRILSSCDSMSLRIAFVLAASSLALVNLASNASTLVCSPDITPTNTLNSLFDTSRIISNLIV